VCGAYTGGTLHRITWHDAGVALGLSYEQIRRRTQTGELEEAERVDGRRAVTFRSVATLAAKAGKSLSGDPADLSAFDELRAKITAFHLLGVERAALLRQLEADALEAEQRGDLSTAAVYWQLAGALPTTEYGWNAEAQSWRVRVPGIAEGETLSPQQVAPSDLLPMAQDHSVGLQ